MTWTWISRPGVWSGCSSPPLSTERASPIGEARSVLGDALRGQPRRSSRSTLQGGVQPNDLSFRGPRSLELPGSSKLPGSWANYWISRPGVWSGCSSPAGSTEGLPHREAPSFLQIKLGWRVGWWAVGEQARLPSEHLTVRCVPVPPPAARPSWAIDSRALSAHQVGRVVDRSPSGRGLSRWTPARSATAAGQAALPWPLARWWVRRRASCRS